MKTYFQNKADGGIIVTNSPGTWVMDQHYIKLSQAKGKALRQAECLKELRKDIKPGDTLYTVLRHVSSSGMSRRIDVYKLNVRRTGRKLEGEPLYLSAYVADLLGWPLSDKGGIVCGGCGMDMGFGLVYNLGRVLFPKGFIPAKAGKHIGRNGKPVTQADTDGGYALNQRWL